MRFLLILITAVIFTGCANTGPHEVKLRGNGFVMKLDDDTQMRVRVKSNAILVKTSWAF